MFSALLGFFGCGRRHQLLSRPLCRLCALVGLCTSSAEESLRICMDHISLRTWNEIVLWDITLMEVPRLGEVVAAIGVYSTCRERNTCRGDEGKTRGLCTTTYKSKLWWRMGPLGSTLDGRTQSSQARGPRLCLSNSLLFQTNFQSHLWSTAASCGKILIKVL